MSNLGSHWFWICRILHIINFNIALVRTEWNRSTLSWPSFHPGVVLSSFRRCTCLILVLAQYCMKYDTVRAVLQYWYQESDRFIGLLYQVLILLVVVLITTTTTNTTTTIIEYVHNSSTLRVFVSSVSTISVLPQSQNCLPKKCDHSFVNELARNENYEFASDKPFH